MDLGIQFPDDRAVFLDDVRRFRELPQRSRVAELSSMLGMYYKLRKRSPRIAMVDEIAEREEMLGQTAIREVIHAHGT